MSRIQASARNPGCNAKSMATTRFIGFFNQSGFLGMSIYHRFPPLRVFLNPALYFPEL
jgi:hypothetical protein